MENEGGVFYCFLKSQFCSFKTWQEGEDMDGEEVTEGEDPRVISDIKWHIGW